MEHAKKIGTGQLHGPLELLGELCTTAAIKLVTTKRVQGEMLPHVGPWLESRDPHGFEALNATVQESREVRNRLTSKTRVPGAHDIGLIALARRLRVPLLIHDDAASELARECGLTTLDLFDVADLVVDLGITSWSVVEDAFASVRGMQSKPRPGDWLGTVQATVEARPGHDRLREGLKRWLET